MQPDALKIDAKPKLNKPVMILGLSGWMDGGDVSTGTIDWLITTLGARAFAQIDPEDFYIYNFPGSMEVSALFRPHIKIEDGLIESFEPPASTFSCDERHNLVLFKSQEPNLNWHRYADCVFALAAHVGVSMIYFVGSVAGLVPHTRAPRLFCAVSDPELKAPLEKCGVKPTNYEGPGSVVTFLMTEADRRGLGMATLVAEIPAYVEATNLKCIELVVRTLSALIGISINLDDLRAGSDELERKLNEAVKERPELANHIRKLEEDYDNDVFDTHMGDLKDWLERQGIRVD